MCHWNIGSGVCQIARLACSMIAFAQNHWRNGIQLQKGIEMFACGVTDRVNQWLLYHGLACGRRSATSALKRLSNKAQIWLKNVFCKSLTCSISPVICINNLDIEKHVHTQSIGHCTWMFHGTWGYVQFPDQSLWNPLNFPKLHLRNSMMQWRMSPPLSLNHKCFFQLHNLRQATRQYGRARLHMFYTSTLHGLTILAGYPAWSPTNQKNLCKKTRDLHA